MSIHILDASAMVAYLTSEPGEEVVVALLSDPSAICYAHAVNFCEVYYDTLRATNPTNARLTISTLLADGIIQRRDLGRSFLESVGQLKARGRISLADCFGIALAQKLGGEIVTADHHEFDPLVPLGMVPIRFIR